MENDTQKIATIVASLIGIIIVVIVMALADDVYRRKYSFSLIGGGIAMFFAVASFGLAIAMFVDYHLEGLALLALSLLIAGVVCYINVKKLGLQRGVRTLIIETLLCLGALLDITFIVKKIKMLRMRKYGNNYSETNYLENAIYGKQNQDDDSYINEEQR